MEAKRVETHAHDVCRLLDRTQTVRSRAATCVKAVASAAPLDSSEDRVAAAARQVLGRALLQHSQQLLYFQEGQHSEVGSSSCMRV